MQPFHKLFKLSFFKQYSWLTVLYGFQLLIPYIILPYLLSTIGEAGYGQIAFSLSIVAYLIALIDYGFHMYGSRQIALLENDDIKQKTFFMNVIYTKLCLFVIGSLLLISLILFLPRLQDVQEILFIFLILAFSYVLNPQFYVIGKQKVKVLALVTMFIKILYVLLVFLFVKDINDLWVYIDNMNIDNHTGIVASHPEWGHYRFNSAKYYALKYLIKNEKNDEMIILKNISNYSNLDILISIFTVYLWY